MKKQTNFNLFGSGKLWAFLVFLLVATFCLSCDEEDDSAEKTDVEKISDVLRDGTWEVTYFFDKVEETNHFSSYTFFFDDDGVVRAVSAANTIKGTWAVQTSDDSGLHIALRFQNDVPFEDLTDDWQIIEQSPIKFKLQHVSGGNGEIQYLNLEKI